MLRLEHARSHRDVFKRELDLFMDSKPYRVGHEVEPQSGDQLVWIEPVGPMPPRLAFLVGDCIHNLRATLDNLITVLPGADSARSAFVILEQRAVNNVGKPVPFADAARRLKGIDEAAIQLIESLQPYQRPDPQGSQLLKLDRLWNRDKHREPSLVLNSARSSRLVFERNSGWSVVSSQLGAFDKRQVLWRLTRTSPELAPNAYYDAEVAVDVVFEPGGPAGGELVDRTLVDLYDHIREDVLPLFEPFF